ncbi:DNA double-strand break repair Rad50 ATPase [Operophtera brumata]|uniref:DNA double-strand break repair Rad50 ATPase n=1 Tax=Operophtera brumata TaxID=104452 RepID=A0A0L7LEA2_OPEBR|nr:DNA double-strand break repair Rad50 ATPase [Operophtera brumata]
MESLSKQELISTITKQADQIKRYEGRLRDVVAAYKGLVKEKEALDIKAAQRRLQRAEARTVETPALLVRLQNKLALLEQSHSVAIREEERVALLESKLAELSETVGKYDLRRRNDQKLIQKLRDSLNGKLIEGITTERNEYLQTLIDKIHILKKEFIAENSKLGSPIDITTIFNTEYEMYKAQNDKASNSGAEVKSEIDGLKNEIAVLKEKLETYKLMLDEEKQDKADTLKFSDLKTRVQSLEKQVSTQRDRYAALLEETDNYIRARNDRARRVSAEETVWKDSHGLLNDASAPPHMLHYAHELARKDLDISQLRKEKHLLEGNYRLRRIQSREGANLEYLKNVVVSYLMSTDYAGRRHMLNAIAAVLHFTSAERSMLAAIL